MTSSQTAFALLLLFAASCQPASQSPNGGAATITSNAGEQAEKRRALRACVSACDKHHARESEAHVSCVRRCLGIEEARREQAGAAQEEKGLGAPWAILFAVGVTSALGVLVLLF